MITPEQRKKLEEKIAEQIPLRVDEYWFTEEEVKDRWALFIGGAEALAKLQAEEVGESAIARSDAEAAHIVRSIETTLSDCDACRIDQAEWRRLRSRARAAATESIASIQSEEVSESDEEMAKRWARGNKETRINCVADETRAFLAGIAHARSQVAEVSESDEEAAKKYQDYRKYEHPNDYDAFLAGCSRYRPLVEEMLVLRKWNAENGFPTNSELDLIARAEKMIGKKNV